MFPEEPPLWIVGKDGEVQKDEKVVVNWTDT